MITFEHKYHAANAATNVASGNDEAPASTDIGGYAPFIFKNIDLTNIPTAYPTCNRMTPFVNEDGYQTDWFGDQRFPSYQSKGSVGNIQQQENCLLHFNDYVSEASFVQACCGIERGATRNVPRHCNKTIANSRKRLPFRLPLL